MKLKKIMALLLVFTMTAASITGCSSSKDEAEEAVQTTTAETKENSVDEESEQELYNAIGTVIGSESSVGKKEETVFVKTNASGQVDSVVVTDWLQNTENSQELVDNSDLKDIKNIKGHQNYTVNGIDVVWDAAGEDIYYQGTSDKELPVDVEISYELDGKPIAPEELGGKSGHVKITLNYINHAQKTVDVGGKSETIYTPFAVVSGMLLETEKFKNVTVTNGTVVSDGNKNVVVGMAFPGFVDSLNGAKINDEDIVSKIEEKINIPSEIVVEADTIGFELGMTLTMISSDAMGALGLDKVETDTSSDLDKITDDLNEFENAGDELVEGTGKLRDGAQQLADGTGDLVTGTSDLYDGVVEYTDGVGKVKDGAVQLNSGAHSLTEGAGSLKNGIDQVNDGAGSLRDGAAQVSAGVDSVVATVSGMGGSVATAADAATKISGGIDQLATATSAQKNSGEMTGAIKAQAVAGVKAAHPELDGQSDDVVLQAYVQSGAMDASLAAALATAKGSMSTDDYNALLAAVTNAAFSFAGSSSATSVNTALGQINAAITTPGADGNSLQGGAQTLASGLNSSKAALTDPTTAAQLAKLKSGAAAVASGASDLKNGTEKLADGAATLKNGACTLENGTATLVDGSTELDNNSSKLVDGSKKLADGSKDLVEGIDKLLDGTIKLNDGMVKFDEEGIQKLTGLFGTDYDSMRDRIHAIADAGKSYKSFSGNNEDEDGAVRFVVESAAIK